MRLSTPLEHGQAPLSGGMLWVAALLLSVANFIAVLDMTIANVSVPNISGGLGTATSQATWVITSYAVAEAITVPLTGWLARVRHIHGFFRLVLHVVRLVEFARHACVRASLPGHGGRAAHAVVANTVAAYISA